MRAYATVLTARLRMLLQYRAAAIAGFATQLFWGLIRMMIFMAFYESAAGTAQPMTESQTVTYIWLGQAFLLLVMLRTDDTVQQSITSGNVVYELLRPIDLYFFWFSRMLAASITPVLLRAGPLMLIATLAGWMQWPDWPRLLCAAATLGTAMLLSSAIGLLMTLSMMWTISGQGVNRVVWAAAYLLGGMIIPLPLFPDSWQWLIAFLPFRGLGDTPFRFFTGNLSPADLPAVLAHQVAWIAAVVLFSRWLLGRGLKRLVVQGG